MNLLSNHSGQIYALLKEQLAANEQLPDPFISRAATACTLCQDALQQLRNLLAEHPFADPAGEIGFFKTTKPPFLAELFYYTKVYQLHLHWPVCSIQMQEEYLRKALAGIQQFFEENRDFYSYHRAMATDRDDYYFRHRHDNRVLPPGIYFDPADTFTTGYDRLLGRILANDRLKEYLEEQLAGPGREKQTAGILLNGKSPLKWTGDIVALVELAYSIVEEGCCNGGNASLLQVVTALGLAFNVDLKNYRQYWADVRRRKSDKPSFMERLWQALKRRLDKPDR